MRIVERIRDITCYAYRLIDADLCLPIQFVPQRLAVDERHDVVEEPVGLARVE